MVHDVGVHPGLLHRRPLQLIGGGSVSAPIPEDDLVAVRDWRSSDRFGRADRAVLAATDETRRSGAISAGTWAELEATVPAERARLEVVIARANWSMFAQLLRSLAPHRRWAGLQSTSSLRCAPPCAD